MTISPAEAGAPHRFWEDVEVGEFRRSREMPVTRDEMIAFASRYDPQYFHVDPERAKASLFGEVVASGIYTAALWRILDHEINGDVAYVCGIAWENVRWPKALRAGDTIVTTSECLSKRPSEKRPNVGVATMRHAVVNQLGEVVMSFDSVDLVYRREGARS